MKISINKTEKDIGNAGYKGVGKVREGLYQAKLIIRIAGKQYNKIIGSFPTAEKAYVARVNYIKKLL